ncbi:hypothetical protein BDV59DRAFT_195962 [Aspergillus ambiguus]|uniref:uncharacterized protein n=1 Tax=Aspergillus ambiguus TaxID=176160 RepID=UPI003CCD59AB
MFRLRRFLPNPQLFFRISPPSPRNSHISNVRQVKFKRPWIRKFLSTCLLYGTAFHLWSSFVLIQFDDTLHDADAAQEPQAGNRGSVKDRDATDESEESADSEPIFIPLGWPRLRKGELYVASDPEWKEFAKISRDREKLQALREELTSIVLSDASRSNMLLGALGGPLTVTGSWLVHHFPHRSPPLYSRSGLEIADTGVYWSDRLISSEHGDLMRKCMRPLYVTLAIRDAYMVLFKRQLARFNIIDQEEGVANAHLQQQKALSADLRTLDGLSRLSQLESSPQEPPSPPQDTPQANAESRPHPSFLISTLQRLPVPKFGPGSDLHAASLAFKLRLDHCWARELHTPPPGVFYFLGPVGVKGPRGFCRLEVKGEYDPATAKWTLVSLQLKDLSLFQQKPLDLDYVCPFSAKMFKTFYTSVKPVVANQYQSKLQVIFRQQIQPWHPSSTLTHEAGAAVLKIAPEKFWDFSAVLFDNQKDFFDVNVVNETRNRTYERLAKLAGRVGVDEHAVLQMLTVSDKPSADGQLNMGNQVTNDIKLMVKANRVIGVHVSPTVFFNGIEESAISSSFTATQWEEWLAKNVA